MRTDATRFRCAEGHEAIQPAWLTGTAGPDDPFNDEGPWSIPVCPWAECGRPASFCSCGEPGIAGWGYDCDPDTGVEFFTVFCQSCLTAGPYNLSPDFVYGPPCVICGETCERPEHWTCSERCESHYAAEARL